MDSGHFLNALGILFLMFAPHTIQWMSEYQALYDMVWCIVAIVQDEGKCWRLNMNVRFYVFCLCRIHTNITIPVNTFYWHSWQQRAAHMCRSSHGTTRFFFFHPLLSGVRSTLSLTVILNTKNSVILHKLKETESPIPLLQTNFCCLGVIYLATFAIKIPNILMFKKCNQWNTNV